MSMYGYPQRRKEHPKPQQPQKPIDWPTLMENLSLSTASLANSVAIIADAITQQGIKAPMQESDAPEVAAKPDVVTRKKNAAA